MDYTTKNIVFPFIFSFILISFTKIFAIPSSIVAPTTIMQEFSNFEYNELKGKVIDSKSKEALISATVLVENTNISTITNDEGVFMIKVPDDLSNVRIKISYLGYQTQTLNFEEFKNNKVLKIKLIPKLLQLQEISLDSRDAKSLLRDVLKKKGDNYLGEHSIMTAFYRETIKKRSTYVSLSEAVMDVYKNPYASSSDDLIKLFKARKSANYKKLDTLTVKLQGGPSSTLYIDVMKNSDILFTPDIMDFYEFSFDQPVVFNGKHNRVISFKQKPEITEPFYEGKLYIDNETLAMTKAVFNLNTKNKEEVSRMFVRKKPLNAKVSVEKAAYVIDYRQKEGKWFFGYSRIDLSLKINWRRKLFNSKYDLNVEMAVTDWRKNENQNTLKPKERLKSSIVLHDEASGFSDPEFWGRYNVIEPEKSIESAIKKIKKQLGKVN